MKTEQDFFTIDAMIAHGGSFVRALGEAAARADSFNLNKIKEAWPMYWAEYEAIGVVARREKETTV